MLAQKQIKNLIADLLAKVNVSDVLNASETVGDPIWTTPSDDSIPTQTTIKNFVDNARPSQNVPNIFSLFSITDIQRNRNIYVIDHYDESNINSTTEDSQSRRYIGGDFTDINWQNIDNWIEIGSGSPTAKIWSSKTEWSSGDYRDGLNKILIYDYVHDTLLKREIRLDYNTDLQVIKIETKDDVEERFFTLDYTYSNNKPNVPTWTEGDYSTDVFTIT